jgi:XTP/dITP diphosphohydrolase
VVRPLGRGDTLVVASHNQGKLREIGELVQPFGLTIVSAADLGIPEPEEIGMSFAENARLKAVNAATAAALPALADDSGLAVDALGGEPGIYSARWAGPGKDFAIAMKKVETELQKAGATTPAQRKARFVAVLCLAFPDQSTKEFRGEVEGTLVWPPRGQNGFSYDPMFLPEGAVLTFGEMTGAAKRALSHRARAFALFAAASLAP